METDLFMSHLKSNIPIHRNLSSKLLHIATTIAPCWEWQESSPHKGSWLSTIKPIGHELRCKLDNTNNDACGNPV